MRPATLSTLALALLCLTAAPVPVTQTIYASVPAEAGASGNSVVAVNPSTGGMGAPVFVGSDPGKLAVTDDGRYVYVALDGEGPPSC